MAARNSPTPTPSALSQALRTYRATHHLSQEQLAEDLHVDVRTVRRYESGRSAQQPVDELRRIADLLGISLEQLGLSPRLEFELPRTPAQIDATVEHVWALVAELRILEAQQSILQLIKGVRGQLTTEDRALLRSLAHAYHAAGYVTATSTRAFEAYKAVPYYHEVETLGRLLEDPTLINIGLTYQGDMYQRMGEADTAVTFLEAARDTKGADAAALGNGIQLLGRAYLRREDLAGFEREMGQAEGLTAEIDAATDSTRGHYNLGTVYEEYGRSYANLGRMTQALDYLERARLALPATPYWESLLATARALALVKGGELRAGVELAVAAAELCRRTGHVRHLDRIYIIQQYLDQLTRDIVQLNAPLRDALAGGQVTDY